MNVEGILKKVETTPTPPVKRVASAFSGGLDSCLGIELRRRKYKAREIIPVTIDIGQGQAELRMAKRHARKLKLDPIIVDVREEFANDWVAMAIKANSDYGGYPVSTSMTRQLVARKVAELAVKHDCDAIIEGSSGKGNDQYRMHNVFTLFAPKCKVLVPVRDFDLTRLEEEVLCRHWNVPVAETITGGDDKTMWCRSIASGAIDLNQPLPDNIWMWLVPPQKAPKRPTQLTIEFQAGVPVRLNGLKRTLDGLIADLNVIAGRNGIGLIDMFEDGIMDLKSREIYEAPAAKVILTLHRDLEQWCLTKDQVQFKRGVDQKWAYMMYHGEAFQPLRYDLEAFIDRSQSVVNGKYEVKLYKGSMELVKRESRTGLFYPEIRSIKATGFNQQRCADAAFVRGLPFMVLSKRGLEKYIDKVPHAERKTKPKRKKKSTK
ncbi:MAG: argininosuccinate synthase [Planctomycetes bacterium DG_58]|nr:MAG: argininosuccinate synthase [Planctomycetes bacterium DG_58]